MDETETQDIQRPRVPHATIVRALRGDIVSGRYGRGEQLPTRSVLEDRYQASSTTVQRALDRLVHEGFAFVRSRQGTFVAENPPHLCRYGLVFPRRPAPQGQWSRWWVALQQQAIVLQRSDGCTISTYYSDEGHLDSADYLRLLADVQSHRLAGLIFAFPPFELRETPVLLQPGLARAAIMAQPLLPGVLCAFPDMQSFFDRSIGYLAQRGRKRVGIIGAASVANLNDHFGGAIARRRMTNRPQWTLSLPTNDQDSARNVAHLLMTSGASAKDRPDALIIADDNLVDGTMAGVRAAGAAVPGDLEIIAHTNFPWPAPRTLPITRLGFDARKTLEACLELVDAQREGDQPPAMSKIPAVFEDEIEADGTAQAPAAHVQTKPEQAESVPAR
jgi:DNA-binding LacI/PurR family transcriptional regulator